MQTDCIPTKFEFQGSGRRTVTAAFDGGRISSDGGLVLLREVDRIRRLTSRFSECFVDARDPGRIEHSVEELLRQRVYGLALGYEDLNDHDTLRHDSLLAEVVGKAEPTGNGRSRPRDRGKPLAGKSTLNRLEWGLQAAAAEHRYHRIALDSEAAEDFFVEVFLDSFEEAPEQLVLDFDATDNPLYGRQEGRFFHGYYDHFCYLPLYVFCGKHVLVAQLRRSNIDASAGSLEVLQRLVSKIRAVFPNVSILFRADSGFARDGLMSWCEQNDVDYVVGLARNPRLERMLEPSFEQAEQLCAESGEPERVYADLRYRTVDSWSCERRVVGKAEVTLRGPNPRFVLTSLRAETHGSKEIYENIYCARGEAENRIKEQQLDLFSTRTSGQQMRVNQVRLWISALAYTLLSELRRLGLAGSSMANAWCETIRLKLLKIGARIRITTRRVWVSLTTAHPSEKIFSHCFERLQNQRAGPLAEIA